MSPKTEAPLHPSLLRPVLLAGAERELVIVNTITVFALVFGLGPHPVALATAALLATAGHSLLVLAAGFDPQMLRVYSRHIRYQGFYPARALFHAPTSIIHPFHDRRH